DQVLAAGAIADESGQRRAERVDPHEGRADQAELRLLEPELVLELRENRRDRLAVAVVEEADPPEHEDDPPLVVGAHAWRLVREGLGAGNVRGRPDRRTALGTVRRIRG